MSNYAKNILFVGEQAAVQPRLRENLTQLNPDWAATFSRGGAEALSLLGKTCFDAVVSDDSLPDMDGFQFLNTVQQQHPASQRFVVSDLGDTRTAAKTVRTPHVCVPKPWDTETIQSVLERAFSLSLWLSNSTVRALVQKMSALPSPPSFYFEIVKALRSEDVDLEQLGNQAAKEPALTARLLQLANSAALGLRHRVTRVQDAIGYLGLEATRSLVLLAHTFSYCDQIRSDAFKIEKLWQHSLIVGTLSRQIAREENASAQIVDECFLAGLLHDVGKLLLAANLPEDYGKVIARVLQSTGTEAPISLSQAEEEAFGCTHAEVGAELMARWNLPLTVVEALALHHRPAKLLSGGFSPVTAVHVAEWLAAELAETRDPLEMTELDLTYLWDVGLVERLVPWREACVQELHRSVEK